MKTNNGDKMTTVVPKENLEAALRNPTIKGVLTRIFLLFIVSFGKDRTPVWDKLMDQYVSDPNNNIPDDRAKQTSAKGNMKREYLGPQLSWAKFCQAMRFAKFSKLKMIFIVTDENGQSMSTQETINFDTVPADEFIDDVVSKRVSVFEEGSDLYSNIEAPDARAAALERNRRTFTTRGKDWITVPKQRVEDIIEEFTIKKEDNNHEL